MRIVKPSGKDSIDMRGSGKNKIAKFDKVLARKAGTLTGLAQRGRTDIVRRPR